MRLINSEDKALRFQPLSQEPQEEEFPISRSSSLVSRPDLSSCAFHHALRTRLKVESISSVYIREGLISHASSWQFKLALILQRETRRRNSAIRELLWSDIDLGARELTWRGELDKSGKRSVTPLPEPAVEALRKAPSRGIGESPVFPAATDPSRPTPRNTFQIWLRRSKEAWLRSVPEEERESLRARLRGVGYHADRHQKSAAGCFKWQLTPRGRLSRNRKNPLGRKTKQGNHF